MTVHFECEYPHSQQKIYLLQHLLSVRNFLPLGQDGVARILLINWTSRIDIVTGGPVIEALWYVMAEREHKTALDAFSFDMIEGPLWSMSESDK
jgi:hypothetical protein